jgi:hypothetical protein
MRISRPFYPWILTLFPILHLYSVNLGQVRDEEVLPSAIVSLAVVSLFYLVVHSVGRSAGKASLVTGVFVLTFFLYGHVAARLGDRGLGHPSILLPSAAAGFTVFSLLIWRLAGTRDLGQMNKAANVMALALLVLPSAKVITYWTLPEPGEERLRPVAAEPRNAFKELDSPARPDVYYIIADGYSSNRHLLREFGYDNSLFTKALERLGFYVAYDSRSNYGATLHSLSSALNMRYVPENSATGALGQDKNDLLYLRRLIADSEAARFLKQRGYTYIYMLSGYLVSSTIADLNVDFAPDGVKEYQARDVVSGLGRGGMREYRQSFSLCLAESTALRVIRERMRQLLVPSDRPFEWNDIRRFFATLDRLEAVPDMPEATFTFVHLLKPHGPVQLDRKGRRLVQPTGKSRREEFFSELELVNERLLGTLTTILRRSKNRPIIILQADHGTHLGDVWTPDHRLTHFEILNAFCLPDEAPERLHGDVSPVNTFRILFSEYFEAELEDLEVRRYDVPGGYDAPFDQIDVTQYFR